MSESAPNPEQEARREQFLADLSSFLIEANNHGWSAEAPKVENPQRPGFKELAYQRDDWEYRDSYAGYYMAPGSSVVYYRERPVWYMTYGGRGQVALHHDKAKETYAFLKRALQHPQSELPVRGPLTYDEDSMQKLYWFDYKGTLAEGSWTEQIMFDHVVVFGQRGDVGLIIDKDGSRNPIYPWDL